MRRLIQTIGVMALVLATGVAPAALVDRGGGMIYDSTRNITWLADMNYAETRGYDSDGLMNWAAATTWASNLVYGGYDDWRLPTLIPSASDTSCSFSFSPVRGDEQYFYGYNCTGGELSGLLVTDLGNKARESVLNQVGDTAEQMANLALFSNVQSNGYWSGTEHDGNAWIFYTYHGGQYDVHKVREFYAVAVRPGDVAAVPEPQTAALVLLALGLAAVVRRKAN